MSVVSCIVKMSGWVMCTIFFSSSILFLMPFLLLLIVVCKWVAGALFVMGCCDVCAWCCCYDGCGCVNGASPVRFVLSLFYLCAFQINPVCVVCVVTSD